MARLEEGRTMLRFFALVGVVMLFTSSAVADYFDPWLPDWAGETGYTSQWWGLHAVGDQEPPQPLAADNYLDNAFGPAAAVWDTQFPQHYYGWLEAPQGAHPAWVDEVWGGMVQMAGDGPIGLTATVPAGSDDGSLKVFVQYDWYNYGSVVPSIAGATDVTPAGYYDFVIGMSGSGHEWYRSTRVFELANPGTIELVLTADGFAPVVDSFSISTAVDAVVPSEMPVPEPTALALLGLGGWAALRRRGRR